MQPNVKVLTFAERYTADDVIYPLYLRSAVDDSFVRHIVDCESQVEKCEFAQDPIIHIAACEQVGVDPDDEEFYLDEHYLPPIIRKRVFPMNGVPVNYA